MSTLITQIQFFHTLKLTPISKIIREKWDCAIEKKLIENNKIHESYVRIEKLELIRKNCPNPRYLLRRKKQTKKCCIMCNQQ